MARFTIAVDRRFKKDDQPSADFITCKAFGKTAEFVEKYFKKGMKIGLVGSIQTNNYTNKEGQKVYSTEVVADNVEFVDSKQEQKPAQDSKGKQQDFMDVPDTLESELPFN